MTSLWYPSSWAVGYDLPLEWIFSKWSYLPLHQVLDSRVKGRYRSIIELVTDQFFGQNDYSVFILLQSTAIKGLVLLIWAPVQPSLVGFEQGLVWDPQFDRMLIMPLVYLITITVWFVAVNASTDRYVPEVETWLKAEADFIDRIYSQFENAILQRTFRATTVEYQRTKRKMSAMRDKAFTMYAVRDASRKRFDWHVSIVYILFLAAAPMLTTAGIFTPGTLFAALISLSQAKSIIADATEVLTHLLLL